MKRIFRYLFLLLLVFPIYCYAEEIDIGRKGNIYIHYKHGDSSISGSDIHLYRVADVNSGGEFTYLSNYTIDDSLKVETSGQWNDLAKKIYDDILKNNIKSFTKCKINDDGMCELLNLDVGLYLVTSSEVTKENYQYFSSPTLIAIPNYNQIENNYIYDIDTFLKVESKALKIDKGESTTNVVPKTIDTVYTYFIILIISILVVILVCLYIKNMKVKEKKNEKNK